MPDEAKKEESTKDELLQIVLEGSDEIIDLLKIMGGRNHLNMAADYERLACQIEAVLK